MDAARAAVAGKVDSRISIADADAIVKCLADGAGVTATEFSTAFLIMREFHFTDEAKLHFISMLSQAQPAQVHHKHAPSA